MGLDLTFNKIKAIEAGLVIKSNIEKYTDCNGEIIERPYDYIKIPNSIHKREIGYGWSNGVETTEEPNMIDIRANKWGSIYKPLTTWLKSNNIKWYEY